MFVFLMVEGLLLTKSMNNGLRPFTKNIFCCFANNGAGSFKKRAGPVKKLTHFLNVKD